MSSFASLLPAIFIVAACGPDPDDSLGSFDSNRRIVIALGCTVGDEAADSWSCKQYVRDRTQLSEEAGLVPCPCQGSVTLHRAKDGKHASMIQYSLSHCPRHVILAKAYFDLDRFIPKDARPRFEQALAAPAGSKQSPLHRKVEATHIYGDRTVELTWTRDVFRSSDRPPEVQDTETLFVAVRPRKTGDTEQIKTDFEPVISPTPRCR